MGVELLMRVFGASFLVVANISFMRLGRCGWSTSRVNHSMPYQSTVSFLIADGSKWDFVVVGHVCHNGGSYVRVVSPPGNLANPAPVRRGHILIYLVSDDLRPNIARNM